jgi:hypothetical protein
VVPGGAVVVNGAGVVGAGVGESPHWSVVGVSDENPWGHKQSVHCAAPPAAELPAPQSLQSARVSDEPAPATGAAAVPGRQVVFLHWIFPPGENWPALQFLQFSWVVLEPAAGEDWPGRHVISRHGATPPMLNRPGSQSTQLPDAESAPAGLALPAGQVVGAHWSWLPLENWPCGQTLQPAEVLDSPICSTWDDTKERGRQQAARHDVNGTDVLGRRRGCRLTTVDAYPGAQVIGSH